ncbi:hypothetical protein IGI04_032983 [Brassica rapa subsp. trilocularis]|uniref:NAC domain-containing protein n=1 Tax=Brassica rapa subsp. trilocularis TaxID=1813537 RepID=A0ABQ7L4K7_BRACM|nr:hypothetical protein IGI04_032983 [Brassica rapa subsp. trilocularis]
MKGTRRSHFKPTNFELLNILHWRLVRGKRCSFITDMQNLYERAPWLLQHVRHVRFRENEWFYFVRRNKRPGMQKADSTRPSRTVGESGIWKTSGVVAQIKNQDGANVGTKRHISFKAKSATVKDGITTGWTMHEFVLDEPWFQEVVLCRIRFYKRKDNAQYAPRFLPIVIGRERGDSIHHGVAAAAGEELQYSNAPVETHEAQGMEQWTGSCSREVVSYLARQQIMVQDSNYPILNGGMMQHQDFGSYGQHFSVNGRMEKHQNFRSYGQLSGEFLGQQQDHILAGQATYVSHMEDHQQQSHNLLGGHGTDPSHSAQTMEEDQQQWNGFWGPYSAQPYDQGMMENQDFESSALGLAQNHQCSGQNNDLSALSEPAAQQQHLGEGSNLSGPSQVQVMMNQALVEQHYVPWSAQANDQYKEHNNELPTVPMETQHQQHDNVIINSAAQLHLEAQDNVPLINETMEAQATDLPVNQGIDESHGGIVGSPTYRELYQEFLGEEEMGSEMDNIWNDVLNEEWVQKLGKNTPEEEAELIADLTNCETFESFLDSLLSN